MVGEGSQRQSRTSVRSRLPRLCLCPQRRDRTCCRRTCRSPEADRRRSVFKHRPPEERISRSTEDSRLVRSHLFSWSAQGGDTGGVRPCLAEAQDRNPRAVVGGERSPGCSQPLLANFLTLFEGFPTGFRQVFLVPCAKNDIWDQKKPTLRRVFRLDW